jgi:hypothetical protein
MDLNPKDGKFDTHIAQFGGNDDIIMMQSADWLTLIN